MGTEYTDDFSKLSGLVELQEAARQLFSAHVLTTEESRNGRILSDTTTKPTLELVENEQMESLKDEAVERLQDAIGDCGDPEMRVRLEGVLSRLHNASSPHEISRMVQEARAAIKEARGGSVSDDDLKKQETWNRIQEINDKIRKEMRDFMTEDQVKKDDAFEQRKTEATTLDEKFAIQSEQKDFHKEVATGLLQSDNPAAQQAGQNALELLEEEEAMLLMGAGVQLDITADKLKRATDSPEQEAVELGNLSPNISAPKEKSTEIRR